MLNSFHQLHPAFSRQCDDVDEFEFYKKRFETSIAHFQEEYQRFLEANRLFTTGISNDPEIEEVYCYQCVETSRFYKKYEKILIEDAVAEVIFRGEYKDMEIIANFDAINAFLDLHADYFDKYGLIVADTEDYKSFRKATYGVVFGDMLHLLKRKVHADYKNIIHCSGVTLEQCLLYIEDMMKLGKTIPRVYPILVSTDRLKPLLEKYNYVERHEVDGVVIAPSKNLTRS